LWLLYVIGAWSKVFESILVNESRSWCGGSRSFIQDGKAAEKDLHLFPHTYEEVLYGLDWKRFDIIRRITSAPRLADADPTTLD
jgi:hypothetical protein